MKPQTKIQIKVDSLARRLRHMNKNHERFFIKCFEKLAFRTSLNPQFSNTWCSECGFVWSEEEYSTWKGNNIICPKCGAELHFEKSRASKKEYKHYGTIITTVGDMQVFRTFRIEKICRKNHEAYYNFFEVVQNWIDERGYEVIRARSRLTCSYAFDAFSSSEIEIRKNNPYAHHLFSDFVYPKMRIIPILQRNGYRIIDGCSCLSDLAISILQNAQSEMLIKTGQDKLLIYLVNHAFIFDNNVISAIKICNRNGYIVKDANLWLDYLFLLEYFHKDIHNSKYVCPEDLKFAHDKLNNKKIKIEKKLRWENERMQEKKSEEKFLKEKSKFFDINFSEDDIKIEPLRSLHEFYDEGNIMHHCVYSMRYFEKPKSLILSARNKNTNERIETIEVNLDNYKIIQSRGICNSQTELHDKIMGIVMNNMNKIREMQRCG